MLSCAPFPLKSTGKQGPWLGKGQPPSSCMLEQVEISIPASPVSTNTECSPEAPVAAWECSPVPLSHGGALFSPDPPGGCLSSFTRAGGDITASNIGVLVCEPSETTWTHCFSALRQLMEMLLVPLHCSHCNVLEKEEKSSPLGSGSSSVA